MQITLTFYLITQHRGEDLDGLIKHLIFSFFVYTRRVIWKQNVRFRSKIVVFIFPEIYIDILKSPHLYL